MSGIRPTRPPLIGLHVGVGCKRPSAPRTLVNRLFVSRGGFMPDRSDEFRSLAAECVAIARTTTDPAARVTLLTMAQKWFDLANGPTTSLDGALREFNASQMRDVRTPAMQQQQQIQPKKDQ
jgi:hypothetical protein